MKSRTDSGMIELLVIFPLFIGLTCVVAWIGFLLIQKTRIEKHAWIIQTQKTYEIHDDMNSLNPEYKIENDGILTNIWKNIGNFSSHLPKTITGFQALHLTSYKKLTLDESSPSAIQHFFTAGFKDSTDIRQNKFEAEMVIPGNPMNDAPITKTALQFEAMQSAGFNYPLLLLGIPEVAGIPASFLGDLAKERP